MSLSTYYLTSSTQWWWSTQCLFFLINKFFSLSKIIIVWYWEVQNKIQLLRTTALRYCVGLCRTGKIFLINGQIAQWAAWTTMHASFAFTISPSNEYSGLISFSMGWFDSLAIPGTLKSSPEPHWKHQFFGSQPSLWPNSYICTRPLEKPQLWQ